MELGLGCSCWWWVGYPTPLGLAEGSVPAPGPGEALQGGSWLLWHPRRLLHPGPPRQHAAELLPGRDSEVSLGSQGLQSSTTPAAAA